MKDFTSFDTWDIAETVQSQYATSKRMRAVIDAFWQAINPKNDIDLLYKKLVNPRTAEGYGLDVWGRIVAIGRSYLAVEDDTPYFGFDPPGDVVNPRLDNFGNAPFYKQVLGKVRLADPMFRTYVFLKAPSTSETAVSHRSIRRSNSSSLTRISRFCIRALWFCAC